MTQQASIPLLRSVAGTIRRAVMAPRFRIKRSQYPDKRQLLVDVSTIIRADVRTGIQRVVRALLGQLVASTLEGVIVQPIFAGRNHGYCKAIFRPDGSLIGASKVSRGLEPVEVQEGDVFLGLDLAAQTLPALEGQLAAWRRRGVSVNMVVYDLLPLTNPEWFSSSLASNFDRWFGTVIRQSDRCICISETVAGVLDRLVSRGNTQRNPAIMTIPLGSNMDASFPSSGLLANYAAIQDFMRNSRTVLAVGTIEPRKGHTQLLDALDHLWKSDPHSDISLMIVGRAGWKTEELQRRIGNHPELGKRLSWVGQASDEVLSQLYSNCAGLVSASFQEGFGLPLIEAVSHGAPILARDIPVFREVGGQIFSFFDDDKPAPFAARIEHWLASAKPPTPAQRLALPIWADSSAALLAHLGIGSKFPVIGR